ncbi:hypothetical protein EF01_06630 [Enterococcus faecalis]
MAVMRGSRLRAEKVASVGEHYTQIVKKKTVCKVQILVSDIIILAVKVCESYVLMGKYSDESV